MRESSKKLHPVSFYALGLMYDAVQELPN